MSMCNDIVSRVIGNRENCIANSPKVVADYAKKSRKDIDRYLGLDQKRSGTELTFSNQMENGTMSLKIW